MSGRQRFTQASMRHARDAQWYRIVNHQTDVADVYLYNEIGYWGTTAQTFVNELSAISASKIRLHINSPGGDVFDGIAIYNSIKQHSAKVTVYIDGLAASAASFIAMAGNKIVMARNAELMIHDAWGFAIGNAADMRDMATRLDKVSDNIADIYLQRAGGTLADWRASMLAETWYSASEAKTAGLVDVVTDADAEPLDGESDDTEDDTTSEEVSDGGGEADAKARWDLTIFTYAGRSAAPAPAPIGQPRAHADEPTTPAAVDAPAVEDEPAQAEAPDVDAAVAEVPAVQEGEPAVEAVPPPPVDEPAAPVVESESAEVPAVDDSAPAAAVEPADAPVDAPVLDDSQEWAALTAGLTAPGTPDDFEEWARLVAHLDTPDPSTVDDLLASLREARK